MYVTFLNERKEKGSNGVLGEGRKNRKDDKEKNRKEKWASNRFHLYVIPFCTV